MLVPFGLPNWTVLVDRAFESVGEPRPVGLSEPLAAERLLIDHCGRDELKFARLVRKALYDKVDLSMSALRRQELLAAIGALTMASNRGSVSRVLTFNFDDLLERFLTYYGFFIEPVTSVPAWGSRIDTRIFHIHGFLPSNEKEDVQGPIVLAQKHFDAITGKDGHPWRALMVDLFRTHTCIFIGLSGADANLSSALNDTIGQHAGTGQKDPFWGVRFCSRGDPMISFWEERGVACSSLEDYSELPGRLFEICQAASGMWRGNLAGI